MDNEEFIVPQTKKEMLRTNEGKIQEYFDVVVSLPASTSMTEQWVQVRGERENRQQAKEYIKSLCCPSIERTLTVTSVLYDELKANSGCIEKLSGAVVVFQPGNCIRLSGTELAVAVATSFAEAKEKEFSSSATDAEKGATHLGKSGTRSDEMHSQRLHPAMRDFAVKLGYSHEDIDRVVRKYGPGINQNKLLEELIQCSSSERRLQQPQLNPYGNTSCGEAYKRRNFLPRGTALPMEDSVAVPRSAAVVPRGAVAVPRGAVAVPRGVAVVPRGAVAVPRGASVMPRGAMPDGTVEAKPTQDLRPIVIDGSNVAMHHGNQEFFSCLGIKLCVNWFRQRGHTDITVFVPRWRTGKPRPETPITQQEILSELNSAGLLVFTPCRTLGNRHIVCYDDRYVLNLATETGGIVVSNDNFRDLHKENPDWKEVIEERLLMYVFAKDRFMPPSDPLGRQGPCLDDFLRKGTTSHPRICPYLKHCTFGLRCKFFHPERERKRMVAQGQRENNDASNAVYLRDIRPQPEDCDLRSTPNNNYHCEGPRYRAHDATSIETYLPYAHVVGQLPTGTSQGPRPYGLQMAALPADVCYERTYEHLVRNREQVDGASEEECDNNETLLKELKNIFPGKDQEAVIKQVLRTNCNSRKNMEFLVNEILLRLFPDN